MNNQRTLFSLAVFFLLSFQLKAQEAYNIKLRVTGVKDTVAYLAHYYGKNSYIVKDTSRVDGTGNMVFSGNKALPGGVYLVVLPKGYFDAIITDQQKFSLETDTASFVNKMVVTGSKENTLFYDFQRYMVENGKKAEGLGKKLKDKSPDSVSIRAQLEAIDKDVTDYRKKFVTDNAATYTAKVIKMSFDPEIPEAPILSNGRPDSLFAFNYYRQHYFDNIDFADERTLRTPLFHNKIERFVKQMTYQIPDSINKSADFLISKVKDQELLRYCIWFITNSYETSEIMGMDAVFVHMAQNYYLAGKTSWVDTATMKKIKDRYTILKPLLLGKKIPNAYLTDTTEKVRELHKVKARYTVVFFYDPDCGHCQKETPKLLEFYKKNKSKGVAIYAASTQRKVDGWKKFINEYKTQEFINVWDSLTVTDFLKVYDVYSTPVIYVLNENKEIIAKRLGVEQLEDFINNHSKMLIK